MKVIQRRLQLVVFFMQIFQVFGMPGTGPSGKCSAKRAQHVSVVAEYDLKIERGFQLCEHKADKTETEQIDKKKDEYKYGNGTGKQGWYFIEQCADTCHAVSIAPNFCTSPNDRVRFRLRR